MCAHDGAPSDPAGLETVSGRRARGVARREELFGPTPPEARGPVEELAPWLIDLADDAVFGGIWTRPGLDLRSRSMVTVAVLTVLGHEQPLRAHIRGALRVGFSKEQIVEIITHTTFYAGLPRALAALRVAKGVFDELG